ncbi:MAG: Uma2 family endonuclease [Saprospiraceae bacterium]|nr:Uma2 family endonuclease [Saprospiraceae bacterium]
MLVVEKKISVSEFREMEFEGEDAYYELINGEIVKKSAPTPLHQEISFLLSLHLLITFWQTGWAKCSLPRWTFTSTNSAMCCLTLFSSQRKT